MKILVLIHQELESDERTKLSLADVADLIFFLLKKLMDESINDNEFSLLKKF